MSFIITWVTLGAVGGFIGLIYQWYTGEDINLKDFVIGLVLFLGFGPLGLFGVVLLIAEEVFEKIKDRPFIKGRKQ